MATELQPGVLRRRWLNWWLRNDLPERTARMRWLRLLGFSLFLHDRPADAIRALKGRYRAYRRTEQDFQAFEALFS